MLTNDTPSKCPGLIEFIQIIPPNLLTPYGEARYFDSPRLGCSFETSFHETGNLVNMIFIGSPSEAVNRNGTTLSPEVHIAILKDLWLFRGAANISAEDIRRIAIALARDWDFYPSSFFLRGYQNQFKPEGKSASRNRSSVKTGMSQGNCPVLISFIRRLPRHLLIPYDNNPSNHFPSDPSTALRFFEDNTGCHFRIEPHSTGKDVTMIFGGTVAESVRRGCQSFIPQVQITLSNDVWRHQRSQRKLKADDIRDLAVALATEWETAPTILYISSSWDPSDFFSSVAAPNGSHSVASSFNTTEDPDESIGSIQEGSEPVSDSSF